MQNLDLQAMGSIDVSGKGYEGGIQYQNGNGPLQSFKIKIFLPVASVSEKDIPLKWLLTSLQDTGEEDCC